MRNNQRRDNVENVSRQSPASRLEHQAALRLHGLMFHASGESEFEFSGIEKGSDQRRIDSYQRRVQYDQQPHPNVIAIPVDNGPATTGMFHHCVTSFQKPPHEWATFAK